jgi:hypothetical protein
MLEVRPSHDDEIDIFELFETLWLGKWLIGTFVAISLLLSGGFLFIATPVYESKINFSIQTPIPYYTNENLKYDFEGMFYSKSMFDTWKSENEKSELDYKDFRITKVINGFMFAKEKQDLLAYLVEDKENKSSSTLVVKTNKLVLINEFFEYLRFINNTLTSNYLLREKKVLKILQEIKKSEKDNDSRTYLEMISRFVIAIENGSRVMILNHPSFPKKTSPKIKLIIPLSIVLGGMIGAVIVLVNNKIRKRKESVSKV